MLQNNKRQHGNPLDIELPVPTDGMLLAVETGDRKMNLTFVKQIEVCLLSAKIVWYFVY